MHYQQQRANGVIIDEPCHILQSVLSAPSPIHSLEVHRWRSSYDCSPCFFRPEATTHHEIMPQCICAYVRVCACKRSNTYTAPHATHSSCSGTYTTDKASVEPIGCRLSTHNRLQPCSQSHMQLRSAVYSHYPRNPGNYMDYHSFKDPKGM